MKYFFYGVLFIALIAAISSLFEGCTDDHQGRILSLEQSVRIESMEDVRHRAILNCGTDQQCVKNVNAVVDHNIVSIVEGDAI